MKKIQFFLSLTVLVGFLASCSNKVDLYADYKDIPVIYGLLDATQDTNFIKIVRAFSGSDEASVDATQVALIPDSCNYPGKLDAKIYRYKHAYGNSYSLDGTIELDTLTIHDKDSGTFYYPNQKVYYATNGIKPNTDNATYKYRLEIVRGTDTISSETGMVGGSGFAILNPLMDFVLDETTDSEKILFRPAANAAVYHMEFDFRFKKTIGGVSTFHTIHHSFGMKSVESLSMENGDTYYISCGKNLLFNLLDLARANDDQLHTTYTYDPKNSLTISLAAGGDELYNYIVINQGAGGLSQSVPDYTNINGGYGVFSSRVNIQKTVRLGYRAQADMTTFGFLPEDF